MISDSYFEQGVTHEVCEDYAVHGEGYAIVSDGCSNGGGPRIDSDWGARLLCKASEELLNHNFDPNVFIPLVGARVKMLMSSLPNLGPDCLTATLMILRVLNNNFHAFTIGDGVVGGKRKDGRWKIHVIEFPKGPFYLKYNIFGEEQKFFNSFGNKFKIGTYFGNLMTPDMAAPESPKYQQRLMEWFQVMTYSEKEHTLDPASPFNVFEFPVDEYEFAFVASDGMESFYQTQIDTSRKHNETICVLDALRVVMDFVTIRPEFACLQRQWAFRQDKTGTLVRRKWKNSDDVSVGVIHV
jgi:hypothetical protein